MTRPQDMDLTWYATATFRRQRHAGGAVTPISPDCEQGKHGACSGAAWDHDNDSPADCTCSCHQPLEVRP